MWCRGGSGDQRVLASDLLALRTASTIRFVLLAQIRQTGFSPFSPCVNRLYLWATSREGHFGGTISSQPCPLLTTVSTGECPITGQTRLLFRNTFLSCIPAHSGLCHSMGSFLPLPIVYEEFSSFSVFQRLTLYRQQSGTAGPPLILEHIPTWLPKPQLPWNVLMRSTNVQHYPASQQWNTPSWSLCRFLRHHIPGFSLAIPFHFLLVTAPSLSNL